MYTPPSAEKYFHRSRSPEETVRLFRYAVEAKQYDAAYRSMTTSFRERYTRRELSLAVRYGSWDGRGIRSVVVESYQKPGWEDVRGLPTGEAAWVTLVDFDDPEDPATDSRELSLFLHYEDGEWRIDPEQQRPEYESFFGDFSAR